MLNERNYPMKQKALIVRSDKPDSLIELNELLEIGWNIHSCTPIPVSVSAAVGGQSSHDRVLYGIGECLVIITR